MGVTNPTKPKLLCSVQVVYWGVAALQDGPGSETNATIFSSLAWTQQSSKATSAWMSWRSCCSTMQRKDCPRGIHKGCPNVRQSRLLQIFSSWSVSISLCKSPDLVVEWCQMTELGGRTMSYAWTLDSQSVPLHRIILKCLSREIVIPRFPPYNCPSAAQQQQLVSSKWQSFNSWVHKLSVQDALSWWQTNFVAIDRACRGKCAVLDAQRVCNWGSSTRPSEPRVCRRGSGAWGLRDDTALGWTAGGVGVVADKLS